MKVFPLALLLMLAPAVMAQELVIPEKSMRDAWDRKQQQFDSLSSEYDTSLERDYGYSDLNQREHFEKQRPADDALKGDKREILPEKGMDNVRPEDIR